MGQNVPGPLPPWRYSPPKRQPPLKFEKRSAHGKYITSKFSWPVISGWVHTLLSPATYPFFLHHSPLIYIF